jgi:hypothetical protein
MTRSISTALTSLTLKWYGSCPNPELIRVQEDPVDVRPDEIINGYEELGAESEDAVLAPPEPDPVPAVPPAPVIPAPVIPQPKKVYVIGATVAPPPLPTVKQFCHDPRGAKHYGDLKLCNVTLPSLSFGNDSLEGRERDWFQGFFYPDGEDNDGNPYWITLKTTIVERFGAETWKSMLAVGQDRINRGHLHTWDGTMFDPQDHDCFFCDCDELGTHTTKLPGTCAEPCTAAQNKHDSPSQSKGQYSIGHLAHLQCGGKFQRVLRLAVFFWEVNVQYYKADGVCFWETDGEEAWLEHFRPWLPIYELLVSSWMHQQNWIAGKLGNALPYPKVHVKPAPGGKGLGKGKGKGKGKKGKGKGFVPAHPVQPQRGAQGTHQSLLMPYAQGAPQGRPQAQSQARGMPQGRASAHSPGQGWDNSYSNATQQCTPSASPAPPRRPNPPPASNKRSSAQAFEGRPPPSGPAPTNVTEHSIRADTMTQLRAAGFSIADVLAFLNDSN